MYSMELRNAWVGVDIIIDDTQRHLNSNAKTML